MRRKPRMRSVWVFHLNTGACNGCDIEILDVLTPYYDAERLGVKLVGSPRHADALLVTGPLTRQTYYAAKAVYEAMPPTPRIVIAVGTCACSGGIFYDSYAVHGGIDKLLPVDMYVPGCPPRPEEIIYGLAQLLGLVEKKVRGETYRDEEHEFRPEAPIVDRLWYDLRQVLTRIVGYFDRETVLNEFVSLVKEAYRRSNPRQALRSLVEEYCAKEEDPRIALAMRLLLNEFETLVDRYRDEGYPVEDLLKGLE